MGVEQEQATAATTRCPAARRSPNISSSRLGSMRRRASKGPAGPGSCPVPTCLRSAKRNNGHRHGRPSRAEVRREGCQRSHTSPSTTFRAVNRAVKLASDPPWVTSPENWPGCQPMARPSSRTMAHSAAVAQGPIS